MNLSLLAGVLLLAWLLLPCLLGPATLGRLWPSAPPRIEQRHSAPDTLARLYRRPAASSRFPVLSSRKTNGLVG